MGLSCYTDATCIPCSPDPHHGDGLSFTLHRGHICDLLMLFTLLGWFEAIEWIQSMAGCCSGQITAQPEFLFWSYAWILSGDSISTKIQGITRFFPRADTTVPTYGTRTQDVLAVHIGDMIRALWSYAYWTILIHIWRNSHARVSSSSLLLQIKSTLLHSPKLQSRQTNIYFATIIDSSKSGKHPHVEVDIDRCVQYFQQNSSFQHLTF